LKFIVYAAEMQEVVTRHGVLFHGFADNSQLIKHILVCEINARKRSMIDCISDIERWCRSYGLKLNADKSDVIWLGSRQQLAKIGQAEKNLHLPSGTLQAFETVRNLDVITDQHLTFEAEARACSKACFFTTFDASVRLRGLLMTRRCNSWCRHSPPHTWIIAMDC